MIRVDVNPMGKPRMTQRDKWKQRPAVMRYRAYCDELNLRLPGYQLPGVLTVIFYLPMPESWSYKKKVTTAGKPHEQKPDIDNLAKGFMDAFKTEDKHVYALNAQKYWSETGYILIGHREDSTL